MSISVLPGDPSTGCTRTSRTWLSAASAPAVVPQSKTPGTAAYTSDFAPRIFAPSAPRTKLNESEGIARPTVERGIRKGPICGGYLEAGDVGGARETVETVACAIRHTP